MNVDVRARRAATGAHESAPDVDLQLRFADLQHLVRRRRRSRAASLAIVTVVALTAVGVFTANRDHEGVPTPMSPAPAVPSVPPTPADLSALLLQRGTSSVQVWGERWEDPADTPAEGADLTHVEYWPGGSPGWGLGLAGWPQRSEAGLPLEKGTVISYGVVVDSTRDGIADYLLGIDRRGGYSIHETYRVWVTDLATNETDVQDGAPYGGPFDFARSLNKSDGTAAMSLFFLGTSPFEDPKRARWYAWSALSQDGEVIAWDTAPDTGWLANR